MNTDPVLPKRGEIWRVDFDATIGAEIRKTRPAVVLSSDAVGKLPVKLIAPITAWNPAFAGNIWHVRIDPSPQNGLAKPSVVDTLQVRGADVQRFQAKLGEVSAADLEAILAAIAAIIELEV